MNTRKLLLILSSLILLGLVLFGSYNLLQVDGEYSNSSTIHFEKMKGINLVASDSIKPSSISSLKENNVNWIVQTPFGWQSEVNSPGIRLATNANVYWGERDNGIIHTTKLAQTEGIKTLLKPHIWLTNPEGKWRSDIEMDTGKDWEKWFASYRKFILHYARLAEKHNIEGLCIGTELHLTAVKHEQEWRDIIGEVRRVYKGKLTYAANWYKEYEDIQFWDDLDFIGIQAYFPLSRRNHPTLKELKKGWEEHIPKIERLAEKYNKPIVFTEVGYRSSADAAIEPWKWPDHRNAKWENVSNSTQAVCYEALFEAFWDKPWFGGTFIWKWFPETIDSHWTQKRDEIIKTRPNVGFSPQQKPAEKVMAKWYGKD